MPTIPQLEKRFAKAFGFEHGLFGSTERARKIIMGPHLSAYVPKSQIKIARQRRAELVALVEKYYGPVKRVVYHQALCTGIYDFGEPYHVIDFVFKQS